MFMPLLIVDSVSKAFVDGPRPVQALQPISFSVADNEFVCLLGPSGSGKSTLLRIIGGLLPADAGRIWMDDLPVTGPRPEIGFVFQKTNLMPWRTVLDNILLPIEIQKRRVNDVHRRRGLELLEVMGLHGFEHAYPHQMSGGMNQRVVLARTLMQNPRLLLMDEPFGQLDALTRERLNLELLRLHTLQAKTILMVTHSINEAVFLADRVIVLSERPGRIVTQILIDLPRPRTATMMGHEHFGNLTAQVRASIAGFDP
jgi:NitT/TauT family transport system ATP-binding protein